jgi:hypothetical protein
MFVLRVRCQSGSGVYLIKSRLWLICSLVEIPQANVVLKMFVAENPTMRRQWRRVKPY